MSDPQRHGAPDAPAAAPAGARSGLERLWAAERSSDRGPRLGLSLERVVAGGIALADDEGLDAVSMKRVAEGLGFTTMSLYRYVTSKDELLLHMHDTAWRPPDGLDLSGDGWRAGLAGWAREQHEIMRLHPWLDEVRFIERAGTPSQIAWMDLGLAALAGAPLSEYQKTAVLLLVTGYVSTHARLAGAAADGARQGVFAPGEATAAFGELLRGVVDGGRFPALRRAVEGGAFDPQAGDVYAPFDFGLDLLLDGVAQLIARQAPA